MRGDRLIEFMILEKRISSMVVSVIAVDGRRKALLSLNLMSKGYFELTSQWQIRGCHQLFGLLLYI
jgi:hypothetical protein